MVRAPCCDKVGLKKGAWTKEEDQILKAYVEKHGPEYWQILPKKAGLLRCGKSCRFRWTNYLRPDVKLGNYSREEEESIINLHAKFDNRWSQIAAMLPGRTGNEIKNVWHTHLKKRQKQSTVPPEGSSAHLEPVPKPDIPTKNTNWASTLELWEFDSMITVDSMMTNSHSLSDHNTRHVSDISSWISSAQTVEPEVTGIQADFLSVSAQQAHQVQLFQSLQVGEVPRFSREPYHDQDYYNSNDDDVSNFWMNILMKLDELPKCQGK